MIPTQVRIFVCTERQDMRRSFDALALAVKERLTLEPDSGALFVFASKRGNRLKVLWFDHNGYPAQPVLRDSSTPDRYQAFYRYFDPGTETFVEEGPLADPAGVFKCHPRPDRSLALVMHKDFYGFENSGREDEFGFKEFKAEQISLCR